MGYLPTTEAPIVEIHPNARVIDIGAAAAKTMPAHARYRYKQGVIYVMDDGRQISSELRALTKPKLAERLERTRGNISGGEMFACFRGDEYCGTVLKMSLMLR